MSHWNTWWTCWWTYCDTFIEKIPKSIFLTDPKICKIQIFWPMSKSQTIFQVLNSPNHHAKCGAKNILSEKWKDYSSFCNWKKWIDRIYSKSKNSRRIIRTFKGFSKESEKLINSADIYIFKGKSQHANILYPREAFPTFSNNDLKSKGLNVSTWSS